MEIPGEGIGFAAVTPALTAMGETDLSLFDLQEE